MVKDDIAKQADLYVGHEEEPDEDLSASMRRQAFKDGAWWVIQEMEKNRLEACKNMNAEEFGREYSFVNKFIQDNFRAPTISDAIEFVVNKACERFETEVLDTERQLETLGHYNEIDKEKSIKSFRKALNKKIIND